MIKNIILFLALVPFIALSQDKVTELAKHEISTNSVWRTDILGNIYVAEKDLLVKYDTSNVKQYSQSIKSKGRITSILSINTMRIVLFSEQQQTFTIMDNTLSEANKTYDLSEFDFGYVPMIAVSAQPNKFWVYDQSNSKLVLLDLSRTNQQQEIENVRSILNSTDIKWLKEDQNKLYMFDEKENLYIFDLYGTLIGTSQFKDADNIDVFKGEIFIQKKGMIFRFRTEDKQFEQVLLPVSNISDFQWQDDFFIVRSKGMLLKYGL